MLVELHPYDPSWPIAFEEQVARIRDALGPKALAIEHVGSTAVPGLPAKPIIDINLTVQDSSQEHEYLPALQRHGFELRHREPDWFEHRMMYHPSPATNLHIFSIGCPELDRMVLFRDHLRNNPEELRFYRKTKERLAEQHWNTIQDYADAKTKL